MSTLIIYRELPGGGKTTYAKKTIRRFDGAIKRINRGDLETLRQENELMSTVLKNSSLEQPKQGVNNIFE